MRKNNDRQIQKQRVRENVFRGLKRKITISINFCVASAVVKKTLKSNVLVSCHYGEKVLRLMYLIIDRWRINK